MTLHNQSSAPHASRARTNKNRSRGPPAPPPRAMAHRVLAHHARTRLRRRGCRESSQTRPFGVSPGEAQTTGAKTND